jgi:hypothetical protein
MNPLNSFSEARTHGSSEAEFVAASQLSQDGHLCALLRGFGYPQRGAAEIWEINASCINDERKPD